MKDSDSTVLRSLQNSTVRRLIRLRDNRFRRKNSRVITDGWRETARAIESGLQLCGLFVPERGSSSSNSEAVTATGSCSEIDHQAGDEYAETVIRAGQHAGVIRYVATNVMEKISFGQSSRGVVAEFVVPDVSLSALKLSESPMLLILDSIEKPGNIGAVFRCADAAGVDAVLLTGSGTDLFNPNAIRSSLGTVFTLPAAVASREEIGQFLIANQIRPLAARVESSVELWSQTLTGGLAVILGSEADGLGEHWQQIDGEPIEGVRIPMLGSVDSLNISVSAAVIVYEAARKRRTV